MSHVTCAGGSPKSSGIARSGARKHEGRFAHCRADSTADDHAVSTADDRADSIADDHAVSAAGDRADSAANDQRPCRSHC